MAQTHLTCRMAGLAAAAVLAAGLAAQQKTDVAKTGNTDQPEQLLYARVVLKEQRVQCFPTTRSPHFEDRLIEGEVVKVGPMVGAFYQVQLPMGVTGYVHAAFCAAEDNEPLGKGLVRTARGKVSFRFRPRSGEAPHSLLPKGTELFYLATEGDWYRVRFATARAFVPVKSVQVFQSPSATLEKSWQSMDERRRKEWTDAIARLETLRTATKGQELQAHKLAELRKRFAAVTATTQKSPEVQRDILRKLHGEVLALDKELAPKAAPKKGVKTATQKKVKLSGPAEAMHRKALVLQQEARMLAVDVQHQIRLAEAVVAIQRKPKSAKDVKIDKPDPGPSRSEKFDAVGWLRYDRRAAGTNRFRLEKGRKLIAYVRASSARYDLTQFDGVEVAVRGSRTTGGMPAAPVIDVTRIEVLAIQR